MKSDLLPSPHSCSFCKDLTLYIRDERWWERAIESCSEDSEDCGIRLGDRLTQWLINPLGEEVKVENSRLPKRLSRKGRNSLKYLHNIVIFDCTIAEARGAAAKGCRLCFCIIGDHSIDSKENNFLTANVSEHCVSFGSIGLESIEATSWGEKDGVEDVLIARPLENHLNFELVTLVDNVASKELSTRPVNPWPSSQDSLSLARTWLQTCLETHQTCPKPERDFMPSRILEIKQVPRTHDTFLQLYETRSRPQEPYVALSYCWGGNQPVKTTKETLRDHLRLGIKMQNLPDTVKHAVRVAEGLGILKIWIDAFCIIQGDRLDEAREIAQMPLIYSQATVTITASRAIGVEKGFLQVRPRMADDTPNQVFELPFRCSDNQLGSVVLLPQVEPSTEPLDTRAWALQERFLSPRILEYGTLQTRWICQHKNDSGFPMDGYKALNVYNNERSDVLFINALKAIQGASNLDSAAPGQLRDLRHHWYNLVHVYTHRTLTKGTDRLPAISGIAAQFGGILRDEYKAGLWKSSMGFELLWTSGGFPPALQPRPEEYQAPSWSWASLNVPVRIPMRRDTDIDIEILDCQIKIQAASVDFSVYDASFGAVDSGSLKVKGRLQPAEWIHGDVLRKRYVQGPDGILPASLYPDALESELVLWDAIPLPVFLLKVSTLGVEQVSGSLGIKMVNGLVLREQGDSKFSRLGVFEFYESDEVRNLQFQSCLDWLDGSPMQTITIV